MNADRLAEIIRAPQVSEKATRLAETHRQIVFRVRPEASKPQIKRAVEAMFEVKVAKVTTLRRQGKSSGRATGGGGRHSDWKKAYVTLQPGFDIDFAGTE
ncbi:MAG TPA: 50S ribosomal protein L23 [Gammaproteobacteria bacterium]|nr:50S ribosomal protein L23 [Gammaproteobacteria bacterium]